MSRREPFVLCLIVGAITLASHAIAQPYGVPGDFIEFTGDVEADFPVGPGFFPITILGVDSLTRDVDPPEGAEALFPWLDAAWRSGIDIKDIRVVVRHRRPDRPRLYVGLNMHGIAGDIDGDGNPDTARDPRALVDVPWGVNAPTALSFQIEFDLDNDGVFDLIAQVSPGDPYANLRVRGINGQGQDPPGDPVVFRAPQAPPAPDAAWPDVEFVIDDFASIPLSGGRPLIPSRVGVQARFSGGDGDDLTEDRLPAFGEILAVCARPTPIAPEDCNGEDDDCDGRIDEGFRTCGCATGAPGAAEQCNGLDDDCDDRIDEGLADCVPCAQRGVGVEVERCDRRDNDCDGAIDEGLAACACADGTPGAETCDRTDEDCDGDIDEGLAACPPACDPAAAMPERCNQRDDDCDGRADEGLAECACAGGGTPLIEACNHRDDDCDALVDEGLADCDRCLETGDGAPPGARPELCNRLDDDCDGTIDEGLADCECVCPGGDCSDLYPTAPLAELCNGVDDDCDGFVDEGTPRPHEEDCDGTDDDCDGRIDEGFRTCGCEDLGVSAPEVCNLRDDDCDDRIDEGQDCNPCELGGGPPGDEICDGRDNDCDGAADEAPAVCVCADVVPRRETACDGADDDCDGAVDEHLLACASDCDPANARPERCNTRDDDCDGNLDEGLADCACTDGLPSIERCNRQDDDCDGLLDEGLRGTDGSVCDPCALGVPASDERCNRLDDDCDGIIDEGLAGCECTCPGGDCADMYLNAPLAELCNGQDDDCDGFVDEDTAGPSAEECNGYDDDCDGRVDENYRGCGCTGGGRGQAEVCNDGDDDCDGRTDEGLDCAPCMFGAAPTSEICDVSDNDCDGLVDEGLACTCEASARERCDGADDDCDGVVDEGLATCADGPTCARDGESICGRADVDCDGQTDEGLVPCGCADGRRRTGEYCNDVDDDCDGLTDEGLPTCAPCAFGIPAGAEVCNRRDDDCDGVLDEGLADCRCTCPGGTCGDLYPTAPLAEECNMIDDDCDGAIDEDFPQGCDACVPAPEACDGDDDDCDGIADEDCGPCVPAPELCDGDDDDCDGTADEDCNPCLDGGSPRPETCNREDDDCDGLTDEGACAPVCTPPDGGLTDERCNARDDDCDGRIDEDCNPCPDGRSPQTEVCNGADDDCDGLTDEDFDRDCIVPTGSDLGDCAVTPGGGRGAPWPAAFALLALVGLIRRRRAAATAGATLALALAALAPRPAAAQDVQLFQPRPGAHDYFTLDSTRTVRRYQLVPSLYLSLAGDPLVSRAVIDDELVEDLDYVSQLATLDLQAVFGLAKGLEIGIDVPLHHTQGTLVEDADEGGFGLGDLRLMAKWAFLPTTADRPVGLGLSLTATLPTGDAAGYVGEGALVFAPRLFAEVMASALRATVNVGARFRPDAEIGALELRDELTYGLGLGYQLTDPFEVIAEGYGRTPFEEVGEDSASSPIEALLGGRYRFESGPVVTAGLGTALYADYGSPRWRVFLGLAWMPDPCGDDGDGDGVGDACDTCPAVADADQRDSDGDGIGDACDLCPARADTTAEAQRDSDGDGIGDTCDLCPGRADSSAAATSDRDGDGVGDACDLCPDTPDADKQTDSDGDGIGDTCDRCPGKPGGATDSDGDGYGDECDLCPDVPDEQGDIDGDGEGDACDCSISVGQVHFETSKWDIKGDESYVTLDTLAKVLASYPEIQRLEIQGHTDTMDSNQNNLTLSKNRAAAVRRYLVEQKRIAPERLMACGYGEEQLAVPTADSVEESRNRRVNFVILGLDPGAAGKRKACGWKTVSATCPDPVSADWVPDAAGRPAPPPAPTVPEPFVEP
ncbi:MAG: OmpA family protein [Myxococcales bacterium]|nr:OmpA family protein [Myxococcales bacterium]